MSRRTANVAVGGIGTTELRRLERSIREAFKRNGDDGDLRMIQEYLRDARRVLETGIRPLVSKSIEVCLPRLVSYVDPYPGALEDAACVSHALARAEWLLDRFDRLTA